MCLGYQLLSHKELERVASEKRRAAGPGRRNAVKTITPLVHRHFALHLRRLMLLTGTGPVSLSTFWLGVITAVITYQAVKVRPWALRSLRRSFPTDTEEDY